ncbi:hypothetical protein [Bradyrhizobium roseum]|uniref:hypothetical protein n=1 Tax=Bradyrhizobium roseum TaxID=3056648 RepID=UPI002603EC62|nr:hypothetical protein [Bradyrhizobium roseus]WKA29103.1 hypothetical protein QUH67_02575 [Bradyrhizobium roseus]
MGRQTRAGVGRGLDNLNHIGDGDHRSFTDAFVNERSAAALVDVWKMRGLLIVILRWSRRVTGLFQRPDQRIEILIRR